MSVRTLRHQLAPAVVLLIIVSAAFCWWVKPGTFLTNDSYSYLSAADSLANQHRLLMADGTDYILWPPLLPVILSASYIFDLDPLVWAGLVVTLALIGTVVVTFFIFHKLSGRAMIGAGLALGFLFIAPILRTGFYALSDIVFLFWLSLGILCLILPQKQFPRIGGWLVLAGLGMTVTRYLGIVVVVTWSAWLYWHKRRALAGVLLVASLLAIGIWEFRALFLDNVWLQREVRWAVIPPNAFFEFLVGIRDTLSYPGVAMVQIFTFVASAILLWVGWWAIRSGDRNSPHLEWAKLTILTVGTVTMSVLYSKFFIDSSTLFDYRQFMSVAYLLFLAVLGGVLVKWTQPFDPHHGPVLISGLIAGILYLIQLPGAIDHHHQRTRLQRQQIAILKVLLEQQEDHGVFTDVPGQVYMATHQRRPSIPRHPTAIIGSLDQHYDQKIQDIGRRFQMGNHWILIDNDERFSLVEKDLQQFATIEKVAERGRYILYEAVGKK